MRLVCDTIFPVGSAWDTHSPAHLLSVDLHTVPPIYSLPYRDGLPPIHRLGSCELVCPFLLLS